jgi:hypothetical protein
LKRENIRKKIQERIEIYAHTYANLCGSTAAFMRVLIQIYQASLPYLFRYAAIFLQIIIENILHAYSNFFNYIYV